MSEPSTATDLSYGLAHGWSSERRVRFLDYLAAKGNVRAACALVGMSRESAYRLRRRDPLFARGWAAALVLARDLGEEVLADRAIEGVEEQIYYRGELIGSRRRYDARLLLAHLGRLDRQVDESAARHDAARFDELLACIGDEHVPDELWRESDALPLDREGAGDKQVRCAEEIESLACGEIGEDECEAAEEEFERWRVRTKGHEFWEEWFESACRYVDRASCYDGECLENHASQSAVPGEIDKSKAPVNSFLKTVSDVSTIALANALGTYPPSVETT